MFEAVRARHGRLDVLVNNAGIAGHESDPSRAERFASATLTQVQERATTGAVKTHIDVTLETTDAEWDRMIAVHLDGTFFCTREALRIMAPQLAGSIINMGSIMGTAGGAGVPGYCAAKAGILGLTRALARELATRQIRVNAIAPGWIETAMTAPLAPLRPILEMQTPLGRMGNARRHRQRRGLPRERRSRLRHRPGPLAQRRLAHEPVAQTQVQPPSTSRTCPVT